MHGGCCHQRRRRGRGGPSSVRPPFARHHERAPAERRRLHTTARRARPAHDARPAPSLCTARVARPSLADHRPRARRCAAVKAWHTSGAGRQRAGGICWRRQTGSVQTRESRRERESARQCVPVRECRRVERADVRGGRRERRMHGESIGNGQRRSSSARAVVPRDEDAVAADFCDNVVQVFWRDTEGFRIVNSLRKTIIESGVGCAEVVASQEVMPAHGSDEMWQSSRRPIHSFPSCFPLLPRPALAPTLLERNALAETHAPCVLKNAARDGDAAGEQERAQLAYPVCCPSRPSLASRLSRMGVPARASQPSLPPH
jgi:hypothetical protein